MHGVTQYVRQLHLRHGWSYAEIAKEVGATSTRVKHWAAGRLVSDPRAQRVLSIPLRDIHVSRPTTDATGSCRRLRDLALRGASIELVSERTRIERSVLMSIRSGHAETVTPKVASAIRSAHLDLMLSGVPGSPESDRIIASAKRRKWMPIGAWSDADDPKCVPDFDPDLDPIVEEAQDILRRAFLRGFTMKDLAQMAGLNQSNMLDIMHGKSTTVRSKTLDALRELEAVVVQMPDPDNPGALKKNRRIAKERGWA